MYVNYARLRSCCDDGRDGIGKLVMKCDSPMAEGEEVG
jgi:hypothetical protein